MRFTISVKIIAVTTIVLLVTLLGSAVATGVLFSREYTRALESRSLAIGQSLSSQLRRLLNLEIPLEDLSGFENQCKTVVDQYIGISYAMVVKPDGRILFHSNRARHGDRIPIPYSFQSSAEIIKPKVRQVGTFYEAVIPVFNALVDYQASIHIGFPAHMIKKELKELLATSSLIGLTIALFSTLILFALIQYLVTKPLHNLITAMQKIREDNSWSTAAKIVSRNDEIGELSAVFDELMHELGMSRAEIEAHAQQLEATVTNRTKELQMANRELSIKVIEKEEAEKRYRELFEYAPVMYVVTTNDPEGPRITKCNKSFINTMGHDRNDIIGRKLGDFFVEDATKLTEIPNHDNGLDYRFGYHERQLLTRDGHIVNTLAKAIAQVDAAGNRKGFHGMFVDITDRKHAEKEKEELLAKLQRAEKLEAIGVLAGGVAHDLNNILSGVVTYPELLLMKLPKGSPLRKPLLTIQSAGQKAEEIVQDLLTLARRGVVTRQIVNVNEIISEYLVSPECEKLLSFHLNITVKTDLAGNLLNVTGSPIHIRKTIMNLVLNAAEAQPDGGEITISTYNHSIDLPQMGYEQIRVGDFVAIEISDKGCGIADKDLDRIFEPFYTKKVMGRSGTGLGMAVVWGTVQDHQGYIDIKSKLDEGSTFILYIPVTRELPDKKDDSIPLGDYMGNGQTILIVDDVEEQREIAMKILVMLNYSPTAVSSGEEAIEYLKHHTAELILLDMIMDMGMDGLDTYKHIIEISPQQKVIIASGYSETYRVKKAQQLGAGQYIKKPYSIEAIGSAVKNALSVTASPEPDKQ